MYKNKMDILNEDNFGYYELISKFNKYTHYELCKEFDNRKYVSYKEKFESLRKLIFTDFSRQINIFYILLNEYGYNFFYDIKDAISSLMDASRIDEIHDIISFYQNSPMIDRITYEDDMFTIYSNGKICNFIPLSKYHYGELEEFNACVFSPFLSVIDKKVYKDENGMIIDFEDKVVMDENTFNYLYRPAYKNLNQRVMTN